MPPRSRLKTVKLSCVIPAFNEAANLPVVIPEVLATLRRLAPQVELVIVNDGSSDNTAQVARDLCDTQPELVLLDLSRNFGKEAALTAGLQAVSGDAVILMDADGQHPTDLLPVMLDKWQEGIDVVYAVRQNRDDQSPLHGHLTGWFYRLINWGSRIKIPANAGDFRLLDRCVVQALNALPERNRFMKGLYAWVGFSSVAVNYSPLPRHMGHTSFGMRGALRLAVTGMLAFSTAPLRLLTWFGLMLSCLALAYGSWVIAEHFIWKTQIPGYATIVVSMMFLSGIQLFALGILSAYVGHIYEEVKQRPLYLVRDRYARQKIAVRARSLAADEKAAESPLLAGAAPTANS